MLLLPLLPLALLPLLPLALCLAPGQGEECFDYDMDYSGHDVSEGHYNSVPSAAACQLDCQTVAACQFWTWDEGYHGACWHKTGRTPQAGPGLVSGPRTCGGDPPGPGGQGKLGIGLNPDTWSAGPPSFYCGDMAALGEVAWWYDWGFVDIHGWGGEHYSCPGGRGPAGFVPIIRKNEYTTAWDLPDTEADTILGFNEPNHRGQDNMSPEETAREWVQIQERFPTKTLVSPAAAPCGGDCNGGDVKDWFQAFFTSCAALGGCRVDFLATHVYSCDVEHVMGLMQDLFDTFNKRIWLTEVACPFERDPAMVRAFMAALLPRLEAAPHIDRYAWFASRFPTQDYGAGWYLSSYNSLLEPQQSRRSELGDLYMSFA